MSAAPPKSAVHGAMALVGLAAFGSGLAMVGALRPWADTEAAALALMAWVAFCLGGTDLVINKVYRRPSAGLDSPRPDPSLARTAVKLLGLVGSLAFVTLGYWMFPAYSGGLYGSFFLMLEWLVPAWLVAAVPYFYLVDRRMRSPQDGYWQMGRALLFRWGGVDGALLGQHLLGWMVKGFFLPLMFVYLCQSLDRALAHGTAAPAGLKPFVDGGLAGMYFLDVTLSAVGYLATLRLLDSHIRSTEPTLLGWAVALACYQPFWGFVSENYLAYRTSYTWEDWLGGSQMLYAAWGGAILLLTLVYIWATLAFGTRFSNLTHRGIITNGPYRYSKHPAYLAKNLSWWLIAVPFLAAGGTVDGVLRCLMLLGVNALYWLRARTEERHLSRDPIYVEYARWMEGHGLLRGVTRLPGLGFLRYRPPA
ncbi:MAG: methyltransferase family protein [Bacillota bacterium]